jgi:membrane protease YdiL (CAAX protease family)
VIGEMQLAALLALACLVGLRVSGRLDFVTDELRGTWRRWVGLAMLFAILALAVFYPVATFGEAAEFDPVDVNFWALFAGHLVLLGFLLAWWLVSGRPAWREYLSLPRQRLGRAVWLGAIAGATGWAVTLLVTAAVAASAGSVTDAPLAPREVPPLMLWLAHLPVWRKAIIVVMAMTVEEGFFRAFLQPRIGLVLSTALFALAHFNYGLPLMVVAVFTISMIFGAVFEARRNLVPCIVAHGVFDSIQIFLIIPLAVSNM